jgi:hypothetical protein
MACDADKIVKLHGVLHLPGTFSKDLWIKCIGRKSVIIFSLKHSFETFFMPINLY